MSTATNSGPAPHSDQQPSREKGLARLAQRLAAWTEKWFPDAYVFAAVGVVLVAVLAMINGASPVKVAQAFGDGFWELTEFTLQMAMVVLTGYVVATSGPVVKLIDWLARIPGTPRSAVSWVALIACIVSLLNWGLSLVFGGLLARAVARRRDLIVDYRALGAAAFMGLGAVWALGLSSSAAQLQATAGSIPPALMKITGVLDFGKTIFTWQSMLSVLILIIVTVIIAHFSAPRGGAIRTAHQMGVDLDDEPEEPAKRERPGEWLEYSKILPIVIGLITLVWLIWEFVQNPFLTVASSLNNYLLVFLILGLVLHGTPRKFLNAVAKAVPSTAAILVQFPLYAAMAGMLSGAEGWGGVTLADRISHFFTAAGGGGLFAAIIAVYSAILGLLVPSGGGKWLVEAPYVMQSATDVHMNLGWTVQIYNMAEALPNMINPFFMLPLLAILKVKARDLVGFTGVQFMIHLPLVVILCWLLGLTFEFVAPVMP